MPVGNETRAETATRRCRGRPGRMVQDTPSRCGRRAVRRPGPAPCRGRRPVRRTVSSRESVPNGPHERVVGAVETGGRTGPADDDALGSTETEEPLLPGQRPRRPACLRSRTEWREVSRPLIFSQSRVARGEASGMRSPASPAIVMANDRGPAPADAACGRPGPRDAAARLAAIVRLVQRCDRQQDPGRDHHLVESGRRAVVSAGRPPRRSAGRSPSSSPGAAGGGDTILARVRRGERVEHFETVRVTKDGRLVDVSPRSPR